MSIRSKYELYGVKNFYEWHFDQYKNPHESIINKSIEYVNQNWNINFSNVLDLACGTGEITKILIKLGYNNIDAIDKYSCKYYENETNRKCEKISFDDILKGKLDDRKYTVIICSFALHLLEISKLPIFLYKLTQISNQLLILSPHKRPIIKEEYGWKIENEIVIDKVKTKLYRSIF